MISDFNATRGIAFSITNQNFDKAGLKKLDSVVEDRKNIKEHFNDLKFEEVIDDYLFSKTIFSPSSTLIIEPLNSDMNLSS